MENLTITNQPPTPTAPPPLGPGLAPSTQPQQLPPQMFTTAAQLLDLTDKKLMVALRDGRKLIGVLRSWDQFANLILQSTTERIFVPPPTTTTPAAAEAGSNPPPAAPPPPSPSPGLYADIPRDTYLIRGENVLLLGEIDLDKDDDVPAGYEKASVERVHALAKELEKKRRLAEKRKVALLGNEGFEGENVGEVLL